MSKRVGFATAYAILAVMAIHTMPASAQMMNKAVETRQAAMRMLGSTMGAIKTYLKEGNGTAAEVEARALAAAGLAGELPALFPKGTDKDTLGLKVSGSNPEIWSNWAEFSAASGVLSTEARKFAGIIRIGDKAAIANLSFSATVSPAGA